MARIIAAADSLVPSPIYRRGLDLFLGYVGLLTFVYGLLTARFYRSWTIADWLINYKAGFIRRGLAGEAALALGKLLHLSPVPFVVLFYLSAYAVTLLCVRHLARRVAPSWWCLALVLSPATASFQVLDVTGGFRKEILHLAALSLFAVLLQERRLSPPGIVLFLTVALSAEILSHETLLFYAPYFLAALYLSGFSLRHSLWLVLLPALVGMALAAVSFQHLGSTAFATIICRSLGYTLQPQGKEICQGGALGYLTYSPAMARARTWSYVRDDAYFLVYPLMLVVALLPLLVGSAALRARGWIREVRLLWTAAAVAFTGSLVLFVYAEDWGRWIYVHIFSLALLLLLLGGRSPRQDPKVSTALSPQQTRRLRWALVAYATLWSLPHVPSRTPPFGYLGLAYYVSHYL